MATEAFLNLHTCCVLLDAFQVNPNSQSTPETKGQEQVYLGSLAIYCGNDVGKCQQRGLGASRCRNGCQVF